MGKTARKYENDMFQIISLKHVTSHTSHENPPGTQKKWAINHGNGQKTRKRKVFGHNSQTCIES